MEELQEDEDVEALLTELFDLAAETELDILKYRDGDEYTLPEPVTDTSPLLTLMLPL